MNYRILMLSVGVAIGYVLGARDGRERYDAMKAKVNGLLESPRVTKARKNVEDYAREQAPIIRERAETVARDVAARTGATAKDVAEKTTATAKDAAERVSTTATEVASKAAAISKDVAGRVTDTAKDVAGRVTDTADAARDQAAKVAADLRARGEAVVDSAVVSAGAARDEALANIDTDDETNA